MFILRHLLIWSGLLAFAQTAEPQTRVYELWILTKKQGEQTTTYHPDGRVEVDYYFTDRGRGPKIKSTYQLNDQGRITQIRHEGNAYLGGSVEETYTYKDGVAEWSTLSASGKTPLGPHVYVSVDAPPEDLALMIRTLLAAPDQSLPALPSGRVTVEKLRDLELSNEDQVATISLYAIDGVNTEPTYVWLDARRQLFGIYAPWFAVTPKDWSWAGPLMGKAQTEADQQRLRTVAQRTAQHPGQPIVIKRAALFDARTGQRHENTTVVVFEDRIAAVYRGTQPINLPEPARIIDAAGHTLLPGLWDMHTHVQPWHGPLHIAAGVTSVRDLANNHDNVMRLTNAQASDEIVGPWVHRAGFIDKKGPYAAPAGKLVDTLEEAIEAVHWYAQRGYPHIKIYSSIDPAWVKPLAQAIHERGMKLSGHIPSFMTTEAAVRDGFDEIQHINFVLLNFLAGPEDDTRTPLRFSLIGDKAADLDLNSQEVRDYIQLLADKNIVVDPTVTIFEGMFLSRTGEPSPSYKTIIDRLPIAVQRSMSGAQMAITEQNDQQYRKSFQTLLDTIKKLHQAGVQLVPGTDATAGFTLHRELELYVQAGIPAKDVLRMATLDSARVVGVDQQVGTIEPGKRADLILVEGDPLKDISQIRNTRIVIKGGVIYESAALYKAVGIQP